MYGLFIGLSYVSLVIVAIILSKIKLHLPKEHLVMYILLNITLSLFGGKLMAWLMNDIPGQTFFQAGLSSYGGLIGGILGGIIIWIITKNKAYMDISVLSLPLMYAIGKIACHSAGCCYGIPFTYGITTPEADHLVFPVQLTETIVFAIIFVVAIYLYIKDKKNVIYITVIASALAKAGLDFLRDSHINQVVSPNQIMSVVAIFAVIVVWIIRRKRIG